MSKQKKSSGALPRNINLVTPVPRPDAQRITRLVKNSGRVEGYELSNGEILTKREGVALAKAGGIRGVPWRCATAANICALCLTAPKAII